MKLFAKLMAGIALFYALAAVVYGLLTSRYLRANNDIPRGEDIAANNGLEWLGFLGLVLVSLFSAMLAVYYWMTQRRSGGDRFPADDAQGHIAQNSGDLGYFSPWSWWPLFLAFGCAMACLGLAVGWWVIAVGLIPITIGLVGWVFEYSRQNPH